MEEWKAEHPANSEFVWNKEQFDDVDPDTVRYLFGNMNIHIKVTFDRLPFIVHIKQLSKFCTKTLTKRAYSLYFVINYNEYFVLSI